MALLSAEFGLLNAFGNLPVVDRTAVSESPESEVSDFGGDGSSGGDTIRSYGFRVRRTGLFVFSGLPCTPGVVGSSFVFLGSVKAQFSHGIARFLSFSSYVFRKLESRLWSLIASLCCVVMVCGLAGGVS